MSEPTSASTASTNTPGSTPAPRPRRRRWPRILLALLIGLVVAPLLAEGGFRLWLRIHGATYDATSMRSALLEKNSRARDFVPRPAPKGVTDVAPENPAQQRLIHPYMGWEVFGSMEEMLVDWDRLGDPSTQDDYEVLLVGGSVADVFGAYGAEELQKRLEADPHLKGRHVYVYKYARGGYKQPQTINSVQYMLSIGFKPECVLAIDGFNEVALSNDNALMHSSPILPSAMHWGALAMNGMADRDSIEMAGRVVANLREAERFTGWMVSSGAWRSAILGTLAQHRLRTIEDDTRHLNAAYYQRVRDLGGKYVLRGPPFRGAGLPAVEDGIRAWKEGSRSLRAICEARGIKYVHVLQPTLHDEGAKLVTDEEKAKGEIGEGWLEAVKLGYPILRAEGAKLAADGEDFIDATRVFADHEETLYYDGCHFGVEGNRIFADYLADEMLKRW